MSKAWMIYEELISVIVVIVSQETDREALRIILRMKISKLLNMARLALK